MSLIVQPLKPQWLSYALQTVQAQYPNEKFKAVYSKISDYDGSIWLLTCLDHPEQNLQANVDRSTMNMETSDVDRENNLELQFMQGTPPGPEAVVQQGVYVPSNSSIFPPWLSSAMEDIQARYPQDRISPTLRRYPRKNGTPAWRIKCLDCPGKLYMPGHGETLANFEVHLKNRIHRQRVRDRFATASRENDSNHDEKSSSIAHGIAQIKFHPYRSNL